MNKTRKKKYKEIWENLDNGLDGVKIRKKKWRVKKDDKNKQ